MKNTFRRKDSDFENEAHIARKKKISDKIPKTKTKEYKTLEYGLEDEKEIIEYEKYIK